MTRAFAEILFFCFALRRSKSERMRPALALCFVLLPGLLFLSAQDAGNQDVLTNQAVVELTKANVGDSVILGMIQTQSTKFSLSKDAIIQLKQQGVSDKVLAAMVKRGASSSAAPSPSQPVARHQPLSAEEESASSAPVGTWDVSDKRDPMSDKDFLRAHILARNDARERIEVTATCSSEAETVPDVASDATNMFQSLANSLSNGGADNPFSRDKMKTKKLPPIETMNFEIRYSPKAGKQLARARTAVTGEVERAPEVLGQQMGNDTVTLRGGEPCVYVRMRVGEMVYGRVNGGCGIASIVEIPFRSQTFKASDMFPMTSSGNNPRVDSFANSLFSMMGNYADAVAEAGQAYDTTLGGLLSADRFLVELPLDDGTTTVAPIPTQAPSFKEFASRCAADFARLVPPPPPPPPPRPAPSLFAPGSAANLSPRALAMRNPPQFAGTADQFAAAFPDFLSKAASSDGLEAKAFDKESAFVVDSVRACAQITPAMAAQGTSRGPLGRGPGIVDLRALGPRYAACANGGSTEPNGQFPDTAISFQVYPGGGNWLQGKGFTVFAFFHNKQGPYPIVSATIPGPKNAEPAIEPASVSPADSRLNSVPSSPLVHTLDDTYERTLQVANQNAHNNLSDSFPVNYIPTAYVCFGITPTGQCQRTGEIVRVPGDLAKPLDWDSASRYDHCVGRIAVGDEVVLKNPAPNDVRKRYLRCTDAVRLAQFYQRMVQLGIK